MTDSSSERLDRIETLVESIATGLAETRLLVNSVAKTAQANTNAIAELKLERQATDRQIAQLTRDVSLIAANAATMFELIQTISDDRVVLAENLANIAANLALLAQKP
jgi:hypothetical protein